MKEEEVLHQIETAHEAVDAIDKKVLESYTRKYSNIVFSSIGKSGLIERVVHDLGTETPVEVSSQSSMPDMNTRSLAIIISYNGKTDEIRQLYEYAQKKTKKLIVISGNEELIEDAKEKGFLAIKLPKGFYSSNSHFLTLFTTIFVMHHLDLLSIKQAEIEEAIITLGHFSKNFKSYKYAEDLLDKIPLIYTWNEFSSLGFIITNYFNLHAKHFAIRSTIPEADYNEVEALVQGDKKVMPIFLFPHGEEYEYARLMMNTFRMMATMDTLIYDMIGKSKLTQIVTTAVFFELVSERLAIKKEVDSTSRKSVAELREKIKHYK